jgi:hypothetical protein
MAETALAVVEEQSIERASAQMSRARDIAGLCREIVVKTAVTIGKKRYVPVEAWCTIANAYGCIPSIREVFEEVEGVRATCDLKRADGSILASAEGFVGNDEPTWASRPLYARRAMAQTRAISRVCRTAYAFIVTMMDAGLSTTPAEEIPANDATVKVLSTPSAAAPANHKCGKETTVRFGKSKGKCLHEIEDSDLAWQLDAALKSDEAADPKWGKLNHVWHLTVQAEAQRRTGRAKPNPLSTDADYSPADQEAARSGLGEA